ncbi:hypothetical protein F5876DRAFT_11281, partial [Lentinula aff. lateritia]
ILSDIHVTDFLLALEIIHKGESPSSASGVTTESTPEQGIELEYNHTSHYIVAWLLEKKQQKHFHKWTGTNQHPCHNKSLGWECFDCIGHFVYQYSQSTVVIAD